MGAVHKIATALRILSNRRVGYDGWAVRIFTVGILQKLEASLSMPGYAIPQTRRAPKLKKRQIQLVANGDLRLDANQKCWPAQANMEQALRDAVADLGYELVRAHPYKESEKHGFISSQKEGIQVF